MMRSLWILAASAGFVLVTASPVPSPITQYGQQQFQPIANPHIQPQPLKAFPQVNVEKRQANNYNNFGQGQQGTDDNYQVQPARPTGGFGDGRPGGNVRCMRSGEGTGGAIRFQCDERGVSTLKYEHVLWLGGGGGSAPAVEILVPNYRVEEIIKAGFKGGREGGRQPINILLQRPQKVVEAEVDVPPGGRVEPEVNIQYEPPTNTKVHYPNDQAYRPLRGPILPPPRK